MTFIQKSIWISNGQIPGDGLRGTISESKVLLSGADDEYLTLLGALA